MLLQYSKYSYIWWLTFRMHNVAISFGLDRAATFRTDKAPGGGGGRAAGQ
jgi:hypothetical protein